jgi:flagellar biosynthesis protein FlhB
MKKLKLILKIIIFVWLVYLIYLNFFYKGSKILCTMGLPAASAITIALFAGILWVGLPISYFLKYLLDKFYKSSLTKNKILQIFFTIAKPLVFIFLLPLVFGVLIVFKALPSLGGIIFSNKYLFFTTQFLGLVYIYLSLSGKFNKYLLR